MAKTVYFYKNVGTFLPNRTMSLPQRQPFSHSSTARHNKSLNTLNAQLNPICHLLALLGAHHILHVSRIRVNMKNSNFSQRRFFKLRACILGHPVDLDTDGSVYRIWNLKMKATFPQNKVSHV